MVRRSAVVIAALAFGVMPAGALATPRDVAATHAYVVANYALARASVARIGAMQANIVRLDRRIGGECPNAGAGSPQDEESQRMSYEVAGALWSVAYGTDAGPIRAFVRAVKSLRWSDHRLTRIAERYASGLHALATLTMPDLCGDVRAWSAGGFQTIPASTLAFDRHVEPIDAHAIPARLLRPYVQPADKPTLQRMTRLETRLEEQEVGVGFNDWNRLLETLGLNQ